MKNIEIDKVVLPEKKILISDFGTFHSDNPLVVAAYKCLFYSSAIIKKKGSFTFELLLTLWLGSYDKTKIGLKILSVNF